MAITSRGAGRHRVSKTKRCAQTLTVPEAGKLYFDLSRDASYDAARRGDIPTIRLGRLLRVPVRAIERMLDSAEPTGKGR